MAEPGLRSAIISSLELVGILFSHQLPLFILTGSNEKCSMIYIIWYVSMIAEEVEETIWTEFWFAERHLE